MCVVCFRLLFPPLSVGSPRFPGSGCGTSRSAKSLTSAAGVSFLPPTPLPGSRRLPSGPPSTQGSPTRRRIRQPPMGSEGSSRKPEQKRLPEERNEDGTTLSLPTAVRGTTTPGLGSSGLLNGPSYMPLPRKLLKHLFQKSGL